ncbi:hypothetical protein E2C01_022451 [Portunus trituberculatus]|uniref:Uncharacterized protein n=1 Tax=Portunus trituberculatus TaxID=210409 RepID=A0A5B7E735_PORTR|nr:hypothetical protein [Portunus trituberculatus]
MDRQRKEGCLTCKEKGRVRRQGQKEKDVSLAGEGKGESTPSAPFMCSCVTLVANFRSSVTRSLSVARAITRSSTMP